MQEGRPPRTIIADNGIFIPLENQNAVKLKLINGISDEVNPRNLSQFYKLNFKTYYLTLGMDEATSPSDYIEKKPKEMNFQEIKNEIGRLGLQHIDAPSLIAEFHRKISISLASLVFVMIGISLGIFTRRGEKIMQFAVALAVIVVYYLLMAGGMAISLKGIEPIPLWIYMPNVIFVIIGAVLFKKSAEG